MTREFNKQWRDDSRPSPRNKPSNRYGEERSPRPARPRLNRESVDRAWESGAQRQHADYRPRGGNGQSPHNGWNNQRSEYSSTQSRPGGYRPYGNNRDDARRFERTPNGNQGPRSRSFDSGRRNSADQRFDDHRGYSDGPRGTDTRRGFRDNDQPRGRGSQFRDQERGNRGRAFPRNGRSSGDFERRGRPYRDEPHSREENPRRQSRPWAYNETRSREPREPGEPANHQPFAEQFEGDYERFDNYDTPRRSQRTSRPLNGRAPGRDRDRYAPHDEPQLEKEERHVTRLPDGRVLKGPRPVQRKNAKFWTEISEDTQGLLEQVHEDEDGSAEPAQENVEKLSVLPKRAEKPAPPKRASKRVASAATRGKKAGTPKVRSAVPKPSQRGFKWPTP
ncbi:MAG: hypothetical protein JOZ18_21665 [Chloroflexi bacterium]|nr:hypothetical protein [Chloroflexota bacterium]